MVVGLFEGGAWLAGRGVWVCGHERAWEEGKEGEGAEWEEGK